MYNNSGMCHWQDCVREYDIDRETRHELLDENMKAQIGSKLRKSSVNGDGLEEGSVVFAPSVKINGRHYRGNFEAEQIMLILCSLLNENDREFDFCINSGFVSEIEKMDKLNFISNLLKLIKSKKLI